MKFVKTAPQQLTAIFIKRERSKRITSEIGWYNLQNLDNSDYIRLYRLSNVRFFSWNTKCTISMIEFSGKTKDFKGFLKQESEEHSFMTWAWVLELVCYLI